MITADFDVIIVGAGAGGCAAAFQLCRAGWKVALIDRGAELPKDGSTLDLRCVIKGDQFKSHDPWLDHQSKQFTPEEHYNVGGKTKWYGAALLEYSREEFLAEDSYQCLGWPIEYDELKPYYALASRLLAIRKFPVEPDLERIVMSIQKSDRRWRTEAIPLGLLSTILEDPVESTHFDGFASVRDLKSDGETSFLNHVRDLPNLTLFIGAEVCDLLPETNHFDRIRGALFHNGRYLRARNVLLAAGALHSPRLLQRYVQKYKLSGTPQGVALAGRNLKMHLLTAVLGFSSSITTDKLRKTLLILNERMPHSSAQPLGFHGDTIATLMPFWLPAGVARFLGRRAYAFFLQTEDGSHVDNRVLGVGCDGNADSQLPVMDYQASRLRPALREHRRFVRSFKFALLKAGMLPASKRIGIEGTAHVNGTLVAGNDPHRSVVAADGHVHGYDGLYVVDGSVLPRSSRVNPSLTIFAWALRVADLLIRARSDNRVPSAP